MATRSGKANTIQPVIGGASPRARLFRNAGFASVWDWGDDADSGDPVGTPIACDIDCVIGVTAEALLLTDSALAVNGMYAQPVDTGVVITGIIDVPLDVRLSIYEMTAFARDCDLRAITLNAREVVFDERVGVSNALVTGFDVDAEVRNLLSNDFDLSLRSYALRTICGDVLISVPDPVLLTAGTSVAVSGATSIKADERIAVSSSIQRLVDCLQSVWGATVRQADLRLVVGERIGLETDQAWLIGNTRVSDCDAAAVIACLMALTSDVEIRTTTRLAPDADTHQTVFAVIVRESHIIEA